MVCFVEIHTHTHLTHLHHHRDQRCLKLPDVPEILLLKLGAIELPQLEGHDSVLLGVCPDELGRQLVHLCLGVDAPLGGSKAQHLLVLGHADVVAAEVVQAVAEAVLVDHGASDHGVNNPTLHFHTLCQQPAEVVGGIVHHLVNVGRSHLHTEPLHRDPRI